MVSVVKGLLMNGTGTGPDIRNIDQSLGIE